MTFDPEPGHASPEARAGDDVDTQLVAAASAVAAQLANAVGAALTEHLAGALLNERAQIAEAHDRLQTCDASEGTTAVIEGRAAVLNAFIQRAQVVQE